MKLRLFTVCAVLALLSLAIVPVFGQEFVPQSTVAPDCDYGGNMKAIEAIDELTVQITLCNADPALEYKVAHGSIGIYSAEYLEATGGTGDVLTAPIGTGPYKLENWDLGNEIV